MKMFSKAAVICLAALIFALNLNIRAFAEEVDLDRHGSATFYVTDLETDAPINTGVFSIYRVAELVENNGSYLFSLTAEFADSGLDLTNTQSARFANAAAAFVNSRGLPSYAVAVLTNGIIKFDDLPTGLYLAVNTVAAVGYYQLNPFVFSIPDFSENGLVYDVIAEPKPQPIKPQGWQPPPESPDEPDEPDEPPEDADEPDESGNNGEEFEDVELKDDTPQTGDDENPMFWIVGMSLSLAAAIAAIIMFVKRKN